MQLWFPDFREGQDFCLAAATTDSIVEAMHPRKAHDANPVLIANYYFVLGFFKIDQMLGVGEERREQ